MGNADRMPGAAGAGRGAEGQHATAAVGKAGTGDANGAPKPPHTKNKREQTFIVYYIFFADGLTELSFPRKGPRLLACPRQDVLSLRAAGRPVSAGRGQRACSGKGPAAARHCQPAATPLGGNSSFAILLEGTMLLITVLL